MSEKLGDLVKKARTAKGLTQAGLAEKVEGVTASDVSKIERGEKEPAQDVIKKMAGVLGVTQKSLLDAASGKAGASASKKTAASKKTSSSRPLSALTLTAAEKKLVQLYRKADSKTKKAAVNLLEGDSSAVELIGALLSSRGSGSSANGGTAELINSLLSGKTGSSSGKEEGIGMLMDILGKLNK